MKRTIIFSSVLFLAILLLSLSGPIELSVQGENNLSIPGFNSVQSDLIFEQPLLLTSAGQSPEIQLAAVLAKRAGLQYQMVTLAQADALNGVNTLGLVVGASLKGLGAAGIDINKEKARVKGLLDEASKKKIPVLFLHLGGDQRRGELTDSLVAEYLPAAKMAVILKSADHDGFFSRICQEHKIPLRTVEKTAEVSQVLKDIFRQ